MNENKPFESIEKERETIRLSAQEEESELDAVTRVIEHEESRERSWLLIPRIHCDAPGPERLFNRNIYLGIACGIILPFVLLHLSLTYGRSIDSVVAYIWPIAAILVPYGLYELSRTLTFRLRTPFFLEFTFGIYYPASKFLSLLGLRWLEAVCFIALAECRQEFNLLEDAVECSSKVMACDQPFQVLDISRERDYALCLLLAGHGDRAIHYAEERLKYWKHILENSQHFRDEGLSEYAIRGYFTSLLYETYSQTEKANELRESIYERVKSASRKRNAFKTGLVCKAEVRFSQGNFEEASSMLEEYFKEAHVSDWAGSGGCYADFMKSRAALCLARCYLKLKRSDKVSEYAKVAKKKIDKDRTVLNMLQERFLQAEIECAKQNNSTAREILERAQREFVGEQSTFIATLIQRKADELGIELLPLVCDASEPQELELVHDDSDPPACHHSLEECSYKSGPVKVVSEVGILQKGLLVGCMAGTVTFLAQLISGEISAAELSGYTWVGLALLVYVIWQSIQRRNRMNKLYKAIEEAKPEMVSVELGQLELAVIDPTTNKKVNRFGINTNMFQALNARVHGTIPAKLYRHGDEVVGLEIFGFATMVSKPK